MMTSPVLSCPACGSKESGQIDSIRRGDICAGYSQALSMDIDGQIPSDVEIIHLMHCHSCDLRWFSPAAAGDDSFYEQLQLRDWYYQDEKPEYKMVADVLPREGDLLEVGCGKGAFAKFRPPGLSYRGLEFNSLAVSSATSIGLDVERKSIQQESAEFPERYDVVCHFQVLEHIPDISGFMKACVGVLRPGGTLCVTVPAYDSFLTLVSQGWLNMPPHHVSLWSDKALLNLASGLGLREAKVLHEPVASFHRNWYENVMREFGFGQLFGIQRALAAPTIASRWARRSRYIPPLHSWLLNRGVSNFKFSGRGHSVVLLATRP